MRPQKNGVRLEVRIPKDDAIDEIINDAELDFLDYAARQKRYRIKLSENDFKNKKETIVDLMKRAFNAYP